MATRSRVFARTKFASEISSLAASTCVAKSDQYFERHPDSDYGRAPRQGVFTDGSSMHRNNTNAQKSVTSQSKLKLPTVQQQSPRHSAARSSRASHTQQPAKVTWNLKAHWHKLEEEGAEFTVSSRDSKVRVTLPTVLMPLGKPDYAARKTIRVRHFLRTVWDSTNTKGPTALFPPAPITARLRLACMNLVSKAVKDKRIHFNSTELSILFHMFFELTHRQFRSMTLAELRTFLLIQLNITHTVTLGRLARAAQMLQNDSKPYNRNGITPMEFVHLLSSLLRGNLMDKAEMAFHAMDIDGDGELRVESEIKILLKDSFDVSTAAVNADIDPLAPERETKKFLADKLGLHRGAGLRLNAFKELVTEAPWIIESLLPCIPHDLENAAFQSLFSTPTRDLRRNRHGPSTNTPPVACL
ncbi:unnamed protein product [Schistocephalus solidus]|uniref:EF-hand domain-containing protein n=1 Tax=Schistocephalus solidus TaxID=70667 RepID=A0A183TDL4_SCHSO|nr:unnamed protein product [Schistocephalus solidus]